MNNRATQDSPNAETSYTVGQVLAILNRDRLPIFVGTLLAGVMMAIYSYMVGESWKATMQVVPTQVPRTEQMGALAEVLSKKAGSGSAGIDLFSALLKSRSVLTQLLASKIIEPLPNGKQKVHSIQSLLKLDSMDPGAIFSAVDGLSRNIEFIQDKNSMSSVANISITAGKPWIAVGMLNNLLHLGQEALYQTYVSRFSTVIARLKQADSIASLEYRTSVDSLTRFLESNRSGGLPRTQQSSARLNQEVQVREQTYLMVRRELEQNRLDLQKIMPPVVQIDSAYVPPLRESPKRKRMVLGGLLAGLLCTTGVSLAARLVFGKGAV